MIKKTKEFIYPWSIDRDPFTDYEKSVETIKDLPKDCIGFVYIITNIKTGKFYIGKKSLYHSRRTRISKREKVSTKTRATFKTVVKESDWYTYHGSSEELKKDIKKYKQDNFKREILRCCFSKKELSYMELRYMIEYDVLRANSYNGNILGKFYRKDLIKCE